MEIEKQTEARFWLQEEYSRRRLRNPQYSLRAFARLLQLPSGRLSEILSDKRKLTPRLGEQIALRLGYAPELRSKFLGVIERERKRKRATTSEIIDQEVNRYQQVSIDRYHIISDWYHFAILSLMDVVGFQANAKWISARLGISVIEVRGALERLLRVGLIEHKAKAMVKTYRNITTGDDITSVAIRNSHRQLLEKALTSLEDIPMDQRDISSISMAIEPKDISVAKDMIRRFRRRFCSNIESSKGTEVYSLNIQFFPMTKLTPITHHS